MKEDWERIAQQEAFLIGVEKNWEESRILREIMEEEERRSITGKQIFNSYGKPATSRRKCTNRGTKAETKFESYMGFRTNNSWKRNPGGMFPSSPGPGKKRTNIRR